MREILFRGKDIANNWHYGVPLVFTEDYVCMTAPHTYNKAVIPESISEFTGLTDKNGKKIFEWDIVRYGDTVHKVVFEQRNGTAYFGLVYNELETLPFGHYQDLRQIEVIGNIHDNPELLKGGE